MENIIELDIEALRKAKTSLEKAYRIYLQGSDDEEMCAIYADSCVKRFEYTFETAWKTMKKYFKLQYSKKEEAKGLPLFCYLFSLSRMFLEAQRFIAGIERTQTRTVRISAAGWKA